MTGTVTASNFLALSFTFAIYYFELDLNLKICSDCTSLVGLKTMQKFYIILPLLFS